MSILHPMWLPSAVQIEVWNDHEWCSRGSGILIRNDERHYIATARHVIDEKFAKGPQGRANFTKTRILDPAFITFGADKKMHVEWEADWAFDQRDNDLAVCQIPNSESGFYRALSSEDILRDEQLHSLQLGHPLIMSGFPDLGGVQDEAPLLVGRQGVLGSSTKREISIEATLGRSYFLLDSFAQSGFSGAPLFSFERPEFSIPSPISIGALTVSGETVSNGSRPQRLSYPHIPAGLAGIVCGHFRSALDRSDGGHAGLSYCVPAYKILELIE